MSKRRLTFLNADEIVSHLPADGHGALPSPRRDAVGTHLGHRGAAAPRPSEGRPTAATLRSACPPVRAGTEHSRVRSGGGRSRARGKPDALGVLQASSLVPRAAPPAAKLLKILAQSADYLGARLAPLVFLATVPRPISSGFPRVIDPHNLTQQRAADAPLSSALSRAWSIQLARSPAAGARSFSEVFLG
jgi:hypothetical protein